MGIAEMRKNVDTMIVVPNERLLAVVGKGIPFQDALKKADEVLLHATQGICDLITAHRHHQRGLRRRAHRHAERRRGADGHRASAGARTARWRRRSRRSRARCSTTSRSPAPRGVLINIIGGEDLTLGEVHQINEIIHDAVGDDAEIIFGAVQRPGDAGRGPGHGDRHRLRPRTSQADHGSGADRRARGPPVIPFPRHACRVAPPAPARRGRSAGGRRGARARAPGRRSSRRRARRRRI